MPNLVNIVWFYFLNIIVFALVSHVRLLILEFSCQGACLSHGADSTAATKDTKLSPEYLGEKKNKLYCIHVMLEKCYCVGNKAKKKK